MATILTIGGIVLIGIGIVFVVVVKIVAGLVPPEFAGMVWQFGNAGLNLRQKALDSLKDQLKQNNITWEDPFVELASNLSREQQLKFIQDAMDAGVPLPTPTTNTTPGVG